MKTHIIIVNWNSFHKTSRCLLSLEALVETPAKVWIIDNGSEDRSAEALEHFLDSFQFPATLIRSGRNLGFGGGCNVGIENALNEGADSVWLINNDAVADPVALVALQERMRSDPKIGAVGSVIFDFNRPQYIHVWGGGRVLLWAGVTFHFSHPVADRRLDYLNGASLLLKRDALKAVGNFDSEKFFMYWEDTDICLRLRQHGWRLGVADNSYVWHEYSSSLGELHPLKDYYVTRSAHAFVRRHTSHPRIAWGIGTCLRLLRRLIKGRAANCFAIYAAWRGNDFSYDI